MKALILILFVLAIIVVYAVVDRVVGKTVDTIADSIHNKGVEKRERENPPKQESLADRMK